MISLKDVCRCFASMDAGKIQLMGIAPFQPFKPFNRWARFKTLKTNTSRRGTSTFREFTKRRISTLKRNRVEFFGFCLMPNHFQVVEAGHQTASSQALAADEPQGLR